MENRQLNINWYCLMIQEEREQNSIFLKIQINSWSVLEQTESEKISC
jgi:hypothetical protein